MNARELLAPEPDRLHADLTTLADYRDPDLTGWSRPAFAEVERASRYWVADLMRAEGLEVQIDVIGNVIGVLTGTGSDRRAIVIGSHTDTVEGGGRFDGTVGVIGAIEVVRMLRASGITLTHDLRVVDFYNEEPNRFGLSCLGSRALASNLTAAHLSLTDDVGVTLGATLERSGWNPSGIGSAAWSRDELVGYLELHIEQGPILEREGIGLGVVTAIAGISRLRAIFTGRRDHAGTMPMALRRDASCSAAGTILAIERIASAGAGAVGTVGEVRFSPEASNVITEHALLTAELRSPDRDWLAVARDEVDEAAMRESQRRGVQADLEWLPPEHPTAMDPFITDCITEAISHLDRPALSLYSGAGHDAVQLARLTPSGMIFIPSLDGRSHCPEEWTELGSIAEGVHALGQSVIELDRAAR